jgi:hypothetical protein
MYYYEILRRSERFTILKNISVNDEEYTIYSLANASTVLTKTLQ